MRGGVSHLESFDPKPELNKHAGKTIGESAHKAILDSPYLKNVREQVANNIIDKQKARIYPLQIGFKPGGQSGIEVSDWWPHLRGLRRRHRRDPLDVHDRQQPRRPDGVPHRPPSARRLPSDDRRLDPLRAGVAERRPAAVHLDGACARVAVLRGRRLRLPRARARGRRAQGRSRRTRCPSPARSVPCRPPRRRSRPTS